MSDNKYEFDNLNDEFIDSDLEDLRKKYAAYNDSDNTNTFDDDEIAQVLDEVKNMEDIYSSSENEPDYEEKEIEITDKYNDDIIKAPESIDDSVSIDEELEIVDDEKENGTEFTTDTSEVYSNKLSWANDNGASSDIATEDKYESTAENYIADKADEDKNDISWALNEAAAAPEDSKDTKEAFEEETAQDLQVLSSEDSADDFEISGSNDDSISNTTDDTDITMEENNENIENNESISQSPISMDMNTEDNFDNFINVNSVSPDPSGFGNDDIQQHKQDDYFNDFHEEIKNQEVIMPEPKKKKEKKHGKFFSKYKMPIILSSIAAVIAIWFTIFMIDNTLASKGLTPYFSFQTEEFEDGSLTYTGAFYKIEFHVETDDSGSAYFVKATRPWFFNGPND